ncbi:unnamed protein product [Calypogeia fissa]
MQRSVSAMRERSIRAEIGGKQAEERASACFNHFGGICSSEETPPLERTTRSPRQTQKNFTAGVGELNPSQNCGRRF